MKKTQHRKTPIVNDSSRRNWDIAIIALLVAVGVVYLPLVNAEFINFDDPDYVYENSLVTNGVSWKGIVYAFSTNDMANWHPLTWLSLMIDAQLYGVWSGGFHLTNVLLHAGGVVTYYFALNSIFKSRAFAFLASLLYAIHPLHVESVAWISERKGILSTFFWMLALLAYSHYVVKPSFRRMLPVAVALTFGLMSKQMLITLPLALLLLDDWPLKRAIGLRERIREKRLLFLICLVFVAIAYGAQKSGGAVVSLEATSLAQRSSNALIAANEYLLKFVFPMGLYIPRIAPREPHQTWLIVMCVAVVSAFCIIAIRSRTRYPHITMGLLWYLCMILPVIGLVPIGIQWMADRYTDIPMIGISWAIVWPVSSLLSSESPIRKRSLVAASIIVSFFMYLSACQIRVWKNSESLFINTLRYDPKNELAHLHLGTMYMATNDFDKAATSLHELIKRENASPIVRSMAANNLIHMLTTQGKPLEAAELLRKVEDFDYASYEESVTDLANALLANGDFEDAYRALEAAISSSPDHAGLRLTLGTLLLSLGKTKDARDQFLIATELDRTFALGFYNLGLAEVKSGNHEDGIVAYAKAIAIDPSRPEFYNNLAVAYVAIGNSIAAVDNYKKAINLRAEYAVAHYNLACILIEKELLDEAMHHLQQSFKFSGQNQTLATAASDKISRLRIREPAIVNPDR